MNTTLPRVRALDSENQRTLNDLRSLPQPLSAIDRLSLRVGLWLLLRSTRSTALLLPEHADHTRRLATLRDRELRERAAQKLAALLTVRT